MSKDRVEHLLDYYYWLGPDALKNKDFLPVAPFYVNIRWETEHMTALRKDVPVVGYGSNAVSSAPEMVVMTPKGFIMPITDYIDMDRSSAFSGQDVRPALISTEVEIVSLR